MAMCKQERGEPQEEVLVFDNYRESTEYLVPSPLEAFQDSQPVTSTQGSTCNSSSTSEKKTGKIKILY